MMLGEFSSDISTLTSQMGTQIFLAAISLYKSMFSHSPKWVFSLRPQTPTPPLLILPLRIWLHLILDWGKQKQSNRTIFLFAISSLLRLPAAVFILSAFVLLPRVECPCSYPKLTNFPLVLGSPSLAFSRMLLLQFPRSLLHHGCLALFWIIPPAYKPSPGPPDLTSRPSYCFHFSLLWLTAHILELSTGIQFTSLSHPVETGLCPALSPLISMLPNLMVKLLLLSHLIAQQHLIW